MRQFSNKYIFLFATIMVGIVALILSSAALLLQPIQDRNFKVEKKRNILASVGVEATKNNAEQLYDKYITTSFVLNSEAEMVEGTDAFGINVKKEQRKPLEEQSFPVFVASLDEGSKFILPLEGKGLWGPLFGYISLKQDLKTINGVIFDHKAETPGLGAEINEGWFEAQFVDKLLFKDDEFVGITIQKGGADDDDPHAVDGISGGTITSKALEETLYNCLVNYVEYLKKNSN